MSEIPHQTARYCQDVESENTEGLPYKKNVHCFKERSNSKNPERARGKWSPEEDEILTQMVNKHGLNNWQTIAHAIPDRNALQCRMRWKNSLDPAVNKEPWSEQEELRLIRAHQLYGNTWLKMVKHFPGRTNYAIKEHWRGPMKKKLDSYLASGLLEQVPDLHDDTSIPDSNTPKDNVDLPERKQTSPAVPTSSKSKDVCSNQAVNADSSGGECSDFTYVEGCAHSAEVSERIIAKSNERATAKRKLDFLSTPVELNVCANAATSSQRPLLKVTQTSPIVDNISPSNVCQDDPPDVPSEFVDTVLSAATGNSSKDGRSSESEAPEPYSLSIHEESVLDLLDMSYCDDLMLDLSIFPHGDGFI